MSDSDRSRDLKSLLESLLKEHLEKQTISFSVRKLIKEAVTRGYPRPDVKSAVAVICDRPEIHHLWGNWTTIDDREELRLRLEMIRSFNSAPESLHDFITFYFRASDPVMYQTAAITLGRHIEKTPALNRYLKTYMKERGIPADSALILNGERSRRRVILSIAACYSVKSDPEQSTEFSFPIDPGQVDRVLNYTDSDLNVFLITLHTLMENKHWQNSLTSFAKRILTQIAKTGFAITDRTLVRNWGFSIARIDQPETDWLQDTYFQLLKNLQNQFRQLKQTDFSGALQVLNQTDELFGSFIKNSHSQTHVLFRLPGIDPDSEFTTFALFRIAAWKKRTGYDQKKNRVKPLKILTGNQSKILNLVGKYHFHEQNEFDSPGSRNEYHFRFFSDLSRILRHRIDWLSASETDKLIASFYMLDLMTHELEDKKTVKRLLSELESVNQLPVKDKNDYPDVLRLLLVIYNLESPGQVLPIDSNLIHQIPEPSLLYTFLPRLRQTDFLAVLADAFEHHLRLQLLRNPAFSPFGYFYKITLYDPSPQLFDILSVITKNRNYSATGGESIAVYEILKIFGNESRLTSREIVGRNNWESNEFSNDSFCQELTYLRNDLVHLHRMDDLFESLQYYADLLDPGLIESQAGSGRLYRMVQKSGIDSDPGNEKFASNQTGRSIADMILSLRKYSSEIQPNSLGEINRIQNASIHLIELLEAIENTLISKIGRVEKTLLHECRNDLKVHVTQWVQVLEKIYQVFQRIEPGGKVGKSNWDEIFNRITEFPTQPMRRKLLQIIANHLFAQTGKTGLSEKKWGNRYSYLRSMALSSYRNYLDEEGILAWENHITHRWMELLKESMESGFETRVQAMMDDPLFHFIYKNQEIQSVLHEIRSWFYDRYDVIYTHKLGKQMNEKGFSMKRELLTFRSYLLHFTNIWIALVIGAILMLDFGDAWTALAELGDTTGILITFFVGIAAAGIYLYINLKEKTRNAPEDNLWERTISRWSRIGLFLGISLVYTLVLTSLLWLLFSATDEVVHGPGALLHILGWTGFALLIGIFFGLLSDSS